MVGGRYGVRFLYEAKLLVVAGLVAVATLSASGQWYPAGRDSKLGPMLDQGLARYETPELTLRLVRSSGTAAGLEAKDPAAKGREDFDFTPAELLAARSVNGYYHLGDLDLRLREAGTVEWRGFSTALERHPVRALPLRPGELERDDLRPTLPAEFPLEASRSWAVVDGKLALRFTLRNSGTRTIEIGALGIPLIFDNVMSGKNLDEAHALCSFSDPSIATGRRLCAGDATERARTGAGGGSGREDAVRGLQPDCRGAWTALCSRNASRGAFWGFDAAQHDI